MAGLRAWLAQTDRKLGVRTYIGAALVVLALAAAGVAIVLTLSLKRDTPTNDEVDSLRDQLSIVEQSASQAAQTGVQSLNQRLTSLETRIDKLTADQTTTKRELQVVQDDIKELRSEVSGSSQPAPGSSSATGTGLGTGAGAGTP
jgi:septal ring factor EnvC (AmiA/AmiB activator)